MDSPIGTRHPPKLEGTRGERAASFGALSLIIVAAISACSSSPPPVPTRSPGPPEIIRYTFSLDDSLEHMVTTVCFEGGVPEALMAIHEAARARVQAAELLDAHGSRALVREGGSIALRGIRPNECVRYHSDLSPRFGRSPGSPGSYRVGTDLVAPTNVWLWAPEPRSSETRILGRFVLPPGIGVSTVWPDAGDGWSVIGERAFHYVAYVAFGDLERMRVPVPGGCIEVSMLDGTLLVDVEGRARWLRTAARAVSRVLGRFPAERVSVLVLPTPFGQSPVLFGIVGRGQLPTVALLVGEDATAEALEPDWTAVHEFTHLASPYVEREDAWITEGLATYYQNVLRAREGLLTAEEAWTELMNGFARGQSGGTGLTLAEEARSVDRTFAWARVYWAGASIALMADVEYRRRSDGEDSLDLAMVRAADDRDRTLSASELVLTMDGEVDGVLAQIAREWLGTARFPDLEATLDWLGVARSEHGARLVDAPGAAIRDAIMNPGAPLASNPAGCD